MHISSPTPAPCPPPLLSAAPCCRYPPLFSAHPVQTWSGHACVSSLLLSPCSSSSHPQRSVACQHGVGRCPVQVYLAHLPTSSPLVPISLVCLTIQHPRLQLPPASLPRAPPFPLRLPCHSDPIPPPFHCSLHSPTTRTPALPPFQHFLALSPWNCLPSKPHSHPVSHPHTACIACSRARHSMHLSGCAAHCLTFSFATPPAASQSAPVPTAWLVLAAVPLTHDV